MDRASLQWVQEDVEQSLRQAQINLEAYLDSPDDGHMLECAETLHGVRGVLEMLEVYGVSLLLDEVGQLCKAVHEGEIARRSDACEVLMQAIVQVPDYLDFITRGNPDNAMIVMPLLNDVRSVRGMALLSENSLFAPDLDAKLPFKQRPVALQGPSFVAYVKKLRPHYQKGLVAWYRGESTDAVNIIEAVVAHVQKLVGSSSVARLWLVARAIIDALKSGGLEESVSIKLLIGQLDRQLRRYMRDGHSATEELGAPQLLKNLLYYCARSSPGTQRLEVVRSVYGLTELIGPGGGSGVSASEILGPNLQTVATVTGELQESLARARDNLDVYTRKDLADRTRADLEAVEALISQVADTLGLLSLGVPRKALVELGEVLKGYIEQNIRPNDAQLMDVATVILRVNGALNSAASKGIDGLSRDGNYIPHSSEETQLTGIEYLQLATSVIGEAKSDIAVIKETIATYIAERQRSVRLDEVPARVAQVAGGIRMLFLEPCADLLERWIGYVEKVLLHAHDIPEDAVLERIADGIESIDYYLEAVVGAFGADADVRLAHATACVEALPELDETEAVFSPYNSARPSEEEAYATVATGPGEFLGHTREDGARRDLPTEHNRAATGSAQEPPDFVDAVGTSDGPGSLGDESINSGPAADTVEILEIESVEEITVMGIAGQTVDFGAHDSTAFDTIDAGPEAPSVDAVEEPIKIEEVEIAAAHSSEEVAAEAAAWEVGEHDEIVVVFDDQADPDLDGEANFAGVEVTLEDESAVRAVAEPAARGDDEVALRFGPLATDARESPPGDAVDDDAPAPMPWSVEESLMKARDLLDRMDRHDAQIAAESESADGQEPETAPAGGLLRSSLLDDGIDDEIIDIFLEEGDDVLAMFDEFLPKWLANPADGALL
ncbi:MAG: hypothetical protein HOI95_16445, partial [Chromatiales bacterium]|nr:hypothetical protein [Chromatiales bacterium]